MTFDDRLTNEDQRLAEGIRRLTQACLPAAATAAQDAAGLQRLQRRALRRSRGFPWAFTLGLPVSVGVAVLLFMLNQPLSFTIEGGAVVGGAVAAHEPLTRVAFSDGSEMTLPKRTRTRIAGIDARGARLVVDEGTARISVRKRLRARWSVEAGPYHVAVHGTMFDVAWTPDLQRFTLALHEGAVTIEGPMAEAGIPLRAGQRLVAEPGSHHLEVEDMGKAEPQLQQAVPAPAEAPPQGQGPIRDSRPAHAKRPPRTPSPEPPAQALHWAALVAQGKPHLVLEEARRLGLAKVLAQRDASSLMHLADAARFAGDRSVSKVALEAARGRFPRAREATNAAFLLGRLAEDQNDAQAAMHWYDTYLHETDRGGGALFVPQALGRNMLLVHKQAGAAAACPLARRYLMVAPAGPYAKLAAEICADPH